MFSGEWGLTSSVPSTAFLSLISALDVVLCFCFVSVRCLVASGTARVANINTSRPVRYLCSIVEFSQVSEATDASPETQEGKHTDYRAPHRTLISQNHY